MLRIVSAVLSTATAIDSPRRVKKATNAQCHKIDKISLTDNTSHP
jgi:hypothetical protein